MASLPIWTGAPASANTDLFELLTDLQSRGVRMAAGGELGLHRRAGAGPSDHKALSLGEHTIMVPIHTASAARSPFELREPTADGAFLYRDGQPLLSVRLPRVPRFYARSTADGVPYWKLATLHGHDVLATTVLQRCVRYGNRERACQFCAIGQSLAAGTTVVEKTPAQLAEVARAAFELDGVQQVVLTTGTPPSDDRGAAKLSACAAAIRGAVELPIAAQCEPPADHAWFRRLADAGVATLGMHLEAVSERVRQRIMPGKAEVPLALYLEAFEAAVSVFGRGQVSTYILFGLGDSRAEIVEACERTAALGVYPFVVPFVPISGTPLASHPPPSAAELARVLRDVAAILARHGLSREQVRAGCARCGACSSLQAAEVSHA